jgi:hypothetical protein
VSRPGRCALRCLAGVLATASAVVHLGCGPGGPPGTPQAQAAPIQPPGFVDVTREAGIDFRHDNGGFGKKLFPEIMGSGAAWIDADQDGFLDLLLLNCETLPGAPAPRRPGSRFYRNRGDGTFEDRTAASGLRNLGYAMGAAVGDVNGDGYPDLYITAVGPDRLMINKGDGTFRDGTREAGMGGGDRRFGSSAAFVDIDNDGDLDLYVCNYVILPVPIDKIVCHNPDKEVQYCDVALFSGEADALWRNDGGGRFTDISKSSGIASRPARGLAVLTADYNGDGLVDIFVANDMNPLLLWRNLGNGKFVESAVEAGVANDGDGKVVAGMGLDLADIDGDGLPELYQSNFEGSPNVLFRMEAPGWFVDRTARMGMRLPTMKGLSFGVVFLDFNQDGWRDLAYANGHVIDDIQKFQPHISYAQESRLFRNMGDGKLVDASSLLGTFATEKHVGRGVLAADYDNDGDLDLLFTVNNGPPVLLRNLNREQNVPHHWIQVRLQGVRANRDGYNAVVRLEAGGRTQIGECRAAVGYLGSNDPRVHFGLGATAQVERLVVQWPGGGEDVIVRPPVDRELFIRQGEGLVSTPGETSRTGGN